MAGEKLAGEPDYCAAQHETNNSRESVTTGLSTNLMRCLHKGHQVGRPSNCYESSPDLVLRPTSLANFIYGCILSSEVLSARRNGVKDFGRY